MGHADIFLNRTERPARIPALGFTGKGLIAMQIYPVKVGMMQCNCYLMLSEQKNAAVIDPGGQPDKLIEMAKELGATIRMVLITHAHFDHIGGMEALCRETGADLYMTHEEADIIDIRIVYEKRYLQKGVLDESLLTKELREGDVLTLDELTIEVIGCPGHSPMGAAYRVGDTLFTGDTLFAGTVGRTDLEGGDWDALMGSLRKLCDLPGDYRVLPGHSGETTLERERKYNPYVKQAYAGRQ